MQLSDVVKQCGEIEIIIDHIGGKQERQIVKNAILFSAKNAHANSIVNNIGTTFQYYISNMIFGTNGTLNGAPKVVDASRDGLFGPTLVNKPVMATVNPQMLNQTIFIAVIGFSEGNGNIITEMALMMKTGDLYSMVTLGGISKDSTIQITLAWRVTFV